MQPYERGGLESVAIVLLLVGGFVYVVGWVAGVALLWMSSIWTTRDKLLGTLVVPGGLLLPVLLLLGGVATGSASGCFVRSLRDQCAHTGGRPLWQGVLIGVGLAALTAAPLATALHLARASRR